MKEFDNGCYRCNDFGKIVTARLQLPSVIKRQMLQSI